MKPDVMKLSTKGRYAMIALTDLAAQGPDRLVSLSEISERQDISLAYLEQLFVKLRRAEIVESVRGPGGGYRLARPMEQVRISDVLAAVDEGMDALTRGAGASGASSRHARAGARRQALGAALGQRLRLPAPDAALRRRPQPDGALPRRAGLRRRRRRCRQAGSRARHIPGDRHEPCPPAPISTGTRPRRCGPRPAPRWPRRWMPAATPPRSMPRAGPPAR
jgi:Rrf2 family transcriptional regulator, iron-sulfur cluster assembly transcription factor